MSFVYFFLSFPCFTGCLNLGWRLGLSKLWLENSTKTLQLWCGISETTRKIQLITAQLVKLVTWNFTVLHPQLQPPLFVM